MSGGLRAAKRASIPSGYGSRLISLTLIAGYAFWNAAIVLRNADSSAADEFQCASVIVVAACLDVAVTPSNVGRWRIRPFPATLGRWSGRGIADDSPPATRSSPSSEQS